MSARIVLPLTVACLLVGPASGSVAAGSEKKVIVLGFDGMDYDLTRALMEQGRMPNFTRLAREGSFSPLGTAVPPQSPVAWSNFITGTDDGGHGIFDFIHRDPSTMLPYLSTSRTVGSTKSIKLGKWQIPTGSGTVELLRKGQAFWDVLAERGIETTIIRIPANFPPSGTATRELSGMGTPDIIGTYGTFSFFTTDASDIKARVTGGKVYEVIAVDNLVEGTLYGPDNPYLVEKTKVEAGFEAFIDPQDSVIKLVVGDEKRVLAEGEWTDWLPIEFGLFPTQVLHGMARFYLKSVRPEFQLYVTPINMDPFHPAMPISNPASYAKELAKATGNFYTQGMPEDTKALTAGVFNRDEFLAQTKMAGDEIIEQYKYVLSEFESGLLFYYFGNLDQISHMMWRPMDPDHPAYDAERDAPYADVIPKIYEQMDAVVGHTLEHMQPQTTLIVMSDHGFTSWRRSFHLNSWLRENGYITVKDPNATIDEGFFSNVSWHRTKAYALGLNGLYINVRGREREGTVDASEREQVMEEITQKLLAFVDPATGEHVITRVYRSEKFYADRGAVEIGPDLVVGYAKGVRGSFESALGELPPEIIMDNTEEWSGDHCMDHETVPGILLTNRPLRKPAADLKQLGTSVLAELEVLEITARD